MAGPGLFYRDMRHLSRFVLRANGETPVLLEARTWGSEAEFLMTAGAGSIRVVRRRALGGGMNDEILLKREAREAIEARIEPGCEADFRDVFDVRGYRRTKWRGELVEEVKDGCLRFAYRREGFLRGTVVRVFPRGGGAACGAGAPLVGSSSRAGAGAGRARVGNHRGGWPGGDPLARARAALR